MLKQHITLTHKISFLLIFSLISSTLSAPTTFLSTDDILTYLPAPKDSMDLEYDGLDDSNPFNLTNSTNSLLLQEYTTMLRQNNFFGTWSSLDTTSRPFQNYFRNPSGLMLLEALDADMSQGGNYYAKNTESHTANALSLVKRSLASAQSYIGGVTTWSLLVKIYDGSYVDQNSANIFYQMMSTAPIYFDTDSNAMIVNDGMMSIYLKDGNGDSTFYKQCIANFSLYFVDGSNHSQPANPNQSPSDIAVLFEIISPDCSVSISSGALTTDGFQDTNQISLYMFAASAIGLLQIMGACKIRSQIQNRKIAFKLSVGSMWLIATVDYYMLILNLVIVFAYSIKFILPLFIYMFLTFYLERDIIIRVLQANRKRGEYDVSDENCRSCGFHFGLSTLLFVFELIFILMSKLWVIHLTAFIFVPQIIHNAKKSRPYNFNFFHVFLLGIIRIAFVAYLKLYPSNIFKLHPDATFVIIYSSIMMAQVFILIIQMKVPKACLFFWDKKKRTRVLDEEDVCPICMCDFKSDGGQTAADSALLDLDETIETSCSHVFHTECLRKWMKNKVECPVCREKVDDILEEVLSSGEEDGQRQPDDPVMLL